MAEYIELEEAVKHLIILTLVGQIVRLAHF